MDCLEEPSTPPSPDVNNKRSRRDVVVERLQGRIEQLEADCKHKERAILNLQKRCYDMREQLRLGQSIESLKTHTETIRKEWKVKQPPPNIEASGTTFGTCG